MKIPFLVTLFLVADAFAHTPVPTLLVCAQFPCAQESCRGPASKARNLVREKIDLLENGDSESGRAVSAKDIEVGGEPFKLFADGTFSRNADGTAYAPHVTVRLIAEGGKAQEARSRSAYASLAIPQGSIDCHLE